MEYINQLRVRVNLYRTFLGWRKQAALAMVVAASVACSSSSPQASPPDSGTPDASDAGPAIPIDPRFRGVITKTRFIPCFPSGLVGGISPGLGPDRMLLE